MKLLSSLLVLSYHGLMLLFLALFLFQTAYITTAMAHQPNSNHFVMKGGGSTTGMVATTLRRRNIEELQKQQQQQQQLQQQRQRNLPMNPLPNYDHHHIQYVPNPNPMIHHNGKMEVVPVDPIIIHHPITLQQQEQQEVSMVQDPTTSTKTSVVVHHGPHSLQDEEIDMEPLSPILVYVDGNYYDPVSGQQVDPWQQSSSTGSSSTGSTSHTTNHHSTNTMTNTTTSATTTTHPHSLQVEEHVEGGILYDPIAEQVYHPSLSSPTSTINNATTTTNSTTPTTVPHYYLYHYVGKGEYHHKKKKSNKKMKSSKKQKKSSKKKSSKVLQAPKRKFRPHYIPDPQDSIHCIYDKNNDLRYCRNSLLVPTSSPTTTGLQQTSSDQPTFLGSRISVLMPVSSSNTTTTTTTNSTNTTSSSTSPGITTLMPSLSPVVSTSNSSSNSDRDLPDFAGGGTVPTPTTSLDGNDSTLYISDYPSYAMLVPPVGSDDGFRASYLPTTIDDLSLNLIAAVTTSEPTYDNDGTDVDDDPSIVSYMVDGIVRMVTTFDPVARGFENIFTVIVTDFLPYCQAIIGESILYDLNVTMNYIGEAAVTTNPSLATTTARYTNMNQIISYATLNTTFDIILNHNSSSSSSSSSTTVQQPIFTDEDAILLVQRFFMGNMKLLLLSRFEEVDLDVQDMEYYYETLPSDVEMKDTTNIPPPTYPSVGSYENNNITINTKSGKEDDNTNLMTFTTPEYTVSDGLDTNQTPDSHGGSGLFHSNRSVYMITAIMASMVLIMLAVGLLLIRKKKGTTNKMKHIPLADQKDEDDHLDPYESDADQSKDISYITTDSIAPKALTTYGAKKQQPNEEFNLENCGSSSSSKTKKNRNSSYIRTIPTTTTSMTASVASLFSSALRPPSTDMTRSGAGGGGDNVGTMGVTNIRNTVATTTTAVTAKTKTKKSKKQLPLSKKSIQQATYIPALNHNNDDDLDRMLARIEDGPDLVASTDMYYDDISSIRTPLDNSKHRLSAHDIFRQGLTDSSDHTTNTNNDGAQNHFDMYDKSKPILSNFKGWPTFEDDEDEEETDNKNTNDSNGNFSSTSMKINTIMENDDDWNVEKVENFNHQDRFPKKDEIMQQLEQQEQTQQSDDGDRKPKRDGGNTIDYDTLQIIQNPNQQSSSINHDELQTIPLSRNNSSIQQQQEEEYDMEQSIANSTVIPTLSTWTATTATAGTIPTITSNVQNNRWKPSDLYFGASQHSHPSNSLGALLKTPSSPKIIDEEEDIEHIMKQQLNEVNDKEKTKTDNNNNDTDTLNVDNQDKKKNNYNLNTDNTNGNDTVTAAEI